NKLLTSYYDYCIGGKTGYTRKSGRTLVSAAKKGKMELIAVTLNAGDDWREHIQLYDWGFNQFSLTKVDTKGKHKYEIEQIAEPITGVTKDNIYLPLKKDEKITKQKKIDERALENNDTIIEKTKNRRA